MCSGEVYLLCLSVQAASVSRPAHTGDEFHVRQLGDIVQVDISGLRANTAGQCREAQRLRFAGCGLADRGVRLPPLCSPVHLPTLLLCGASVAPAVLGPTIDAAVVVVVAEVPGGDRRRVPREIVVQIRGGANQPDYEMKIEVRKGVPRWAEVTLRARPDGPEVRDKDLDAIRLDDWLEQIAAMCSVAHSGTGAGWEGWSKPVNDGGALADIRRVKSGRPRISRERLQKVAEIYRQHFDDRPTNAVATAFGKDPRTAARYVRLAHDAGFLPDTTKGKKEGVGRR